MERSQVVHPGDVGWPLHESQTLGGLLHPCVEVADHRLGPTDDLAFQLDLKPKHAVGGWVLGTHVDDHPLVVGDLVVENVIVGDHRAELLP